MGVIKMLSGFFKSPARNTDRDYWIEVKCNRCEEIIQGRVDLSNDLSVDYDENNDEVTYFCRKVIIGQQRCFQPIEVILKFDRNRALVGHTISGGKFIEP